MSLKVWLPLNGDLKNLGLENLTITNNNATTNTSGKIGSCYYFNGTDARISCSSVTYPFPLSVCAWIKGETITNSATEYILSYNTASGGTAGHNIGIGTYGGKLSIWHGGSVSSYNVALTNNIWYHVAAVVTQTGYKLYLDGSEILSSAGTQSDVNSSWLTFGARSNSNTGGVGSAAYYFKGYMNDVRVYNHALSTAEVKEIAKGLVLHYKFDKKYLISGTNLVTGITQGGQTTKLTDGRIGVITSGSNADTYFTVNLSENITNGTTYTLTCNASGISNGAYWGFPLGRQGNSALPFKIYNGYNEYTFTANDIDWGTKRLFLDDNGRADWANKATFWDFQLYKNGSFGVEDSSGYGYNGQVLGNLIINDDSIRYYNSTNFPTNADGVLSSYPLNLWNNAFTYSFWIKPSGENGGRSIYAASYNGTSCSIEKSTGNKLRIYWNGSPDLYTTNLTIQDNVWQHIAIVKSEDKTKIYCYYNGELKDTFTNTFSDKTFSGTLRIGRDTRGDATSYTGLMSDFRIYATALLDTDIKMLYNTAMKIDNLNNIHTYELDEKGRELLNGVPLTAGYSTHSTTSNIFNGEAKMTGNGSLGSDYIKINPTGHTYYYDIIYSCATGNQFYIGFEKYDASKTARSNNACVYVVAVKPTADQVKIHVKGTVNLATDGVNPTDTIALRILNGWSGSDSSSAKTMTIHYMSLREVATSQKPQVLKSGEFVVEELREYNNAKFYQNGMIETAEIIEM